MKLLYFVAGAADLAEIYGYSTKDFNRQVKNNQERFAEDFRFQLNAIEAKDLRCNFSTANFSSKSRSYPYAFTEQGIYMLMTVLKGDLAIRQSMALIRLFKDMKDYSFDGFTPFQQRNAINCSSDFILHLSSCNSVRRSKQKRHLAI